MKNRGVEDILIAVVDGLKGFPDAITAVFPQAQVQTCIVHLIRNSLDFVSYKDRKVVAAALRDIYKAKDADAGAAALDAFAKGEWGLKYPAIAMAWRRHWPAVIPFFAFPLDVRRIIYTTDVIDKRSVALGGSAERVPQRPPRVRRRHALHTAAGAQGHRWCFDVTYDHVAISKVATFGRVRLRMPSRP